MSVFVEIWENKVGKLIIVTSGVYITMKFFLPLVLPFVLAFLFVALINPILELIHKKTKIGKGFLAALFLFLIGVIIMGLVAMIGSAVFANMGDWLDELHKVEIQIIAFIQSCCMKLEHLVGMDAASIENMFMEKVTDISSSIQMEYGPKLMGESISYVKHVLSIGAGVAVVFIAVVLLAKDYSKIKSKIKNQKSFCKFGEIISKIGQLVRIFLKAQILILLIICIICVIGLLLIGVDNAIGLGIIIGCFDLLPFIGTSIILIPLALLSLLSGEMGKSIGIVVLYIVCVFTRELLEPKLIGDKVGISPIYILMGIYVGMKVYGISGIILGPLSLLIINELCTLKEESATS